MVNGGGGGVYLYYGVFHMTGGEISGNKAESNGGGFAVGDHNSGTSATYDIEITGGKIANNEAKYGDNIISAVSIKIGPDAELPDGIVLVGSNRYWESWETNGPFLLLTNELKKDVMLEGVSTGNGNSVENVIGVGMCVAKMADGSAISETSFKHLSIENENNSLVLSSDGSVRIANPIKGGPLAFAYGEANNFIYNNIVDDQSGEGWTWDKETKTLTITDDINIDTEDQKPALMLPNDSDIIINEGVTATISGNNTSSSAIDCISNLNIQGAGTLVVNVNNSGNGGIFVKNNLKVSGITLNINGTEAIKGEIGIYLFPGNLSLNNCTVNLSNLYFGIVGYSSGAGSSHELSGSNSTLTATGCTYGFYSHGGKVSLEDCSLALASQVAIHTEDNSNTRDFLEIVTLTDCEGYLGINDATQGYKAIEVSLDSSSDDVNERIMINNLSSRYEIASLTEESNSGPYYSAVVQNKDDQTYRYVELSNEIPVTEITLDHNELTLTTGGTYVLRAVVSPSDATDPVVIWSSDNTDVATVDENGRVTAVAPGQAIITATTSNGLIATCMVTVSAPVPPYAGNYNYPVTVDDVENGNVLLDKADQWATGGERVTFSVAPDEAYLLESLTITDKNGNTVKVTDNNDGTFTFTMPEGTVTITATFAEDPNYEPDPEPGDELPFTDISADDWFYDPVVWAYSEGLMTGTSVTTFEPNTSTTRGMIVAILHRLEGGPSASASHFNDVHDGDWYADAVNWAASVGIVAGFEDGSFHPNDAITREQMAAILCNYAQWKGMDTSACVDLSSYSDQPSAWATTVMEWAVGEGLISGTSATTLDPQAATTRAQTAAIFQRFLTAES